MVEKNTAFGSQKNVFWEAFFVALVIFILGLLLGVGLESKRSDNFNMIYAESEVSLIDIFTLSNIITSGNESCGYLVQANVDLADNIYEQASELDKYEESSIISESITLTHRKFDVLRTLLWRNVAHVREKCPEMNYIIYIYEQNPADLTERATNTVWSKILGDLKGELGNSFVLIPIAADEELNSLNLLLGKFNITDFPVVIVNDEHFVGEIDSADDLRGYLD